MINKCFFQSPIGVLILESDGVGLSRLEICRESEQSERATEAEQEGTLFRTEEIMVLTGAEEVTLSQKGKKTELSPILWQAVTELTEYFAGKRREFTVPVSLMGTDFQMQVWQKLREIPYGETCSYGQLAAAVGNPRAARAVGMANNRNPVMIIVPCHRVIGKNGALVGYGGGLPAKKYLLELEKEHLC